MFAIMSVSNNLLRSIEMANICQHCGSYIKGARTSRRKFCDDSCRVAWHRAQKVSPKEQLERLTMSITDSIIRLEKQSAMAEKKSQETDKPLPERLGLIAMFREKQAIANELKLLLEMSGVKASIAARVKAPYCKACGQKVFIIPKRGINALFVVNRIGAMIAGKNF